MLANLFVKLGTKLLTEVFVAKATVLVLWEISRKTDGTKLDDEIVKTVAEALGVKLPS